MFMTACFLECNSSTLYDILIPNPYLYHFNNLVNDSLSDVETFELIPVNGVTFTINQCFYNKATKRVDILAECTCTTGIGANVGFASVPTKYKPLNAIVRGVVLRLNNTNGTSNIGVNVFGETAVITQSLTGGMTHISFTISYYC